MQTLRPYKHWWINNTFISILLDLWCTCGTRNKTTPSTSHRTIICCIMQQWSHTTILPIHNLCLNKMWIHSLKYPDQWRLRPCHNIHHISSVCLQPGHRSCKPCAEPWLEGQSLGWNLRQELLASLVCLQLVNVFHEDALVLEHVTLRPQVEAVVPEGQQGGRKTH